MNWRQITETPEIGVPLLLKCREAGSDITLYITGYFRTDTGRPNWQDYFGWAAYPFGWCYQSEVE